MPENRSENESRAETGGEDAGPRSPEDAVSSCSRASGTHGAGSVAIIPQSARFPNGNFAAVFGLPPRSPPAVDLGLQDTDVGQVAVEAGVVQAVADDEPVFHRKPAIIHGDFHPAS